jgi:surfeit locus 1 family protein
LTSLPRRNLTRLIWAGAFTVLGIAALVALGVWQLHRLTWKEALLDAINSRVHAPPVAPPPATQWSRLDPQDYEYRHVRVEGSFEPGKQALVFRNIESPRGRYGGVGYLVMAPLRLADGSAIVVNRGFVPQELRDSPRIVAPASSVVTGLMRSPETRTLFTPADNPAKGEWFTRDPAAIAAALKVSDAAPFTIDADAGGDLPEGGETVLDFPNNHFSYALTWFGLAIALGGVYAAFALKTLRETP